MDPDAAALEHLCREVGVGSLAGRVLWGRGLAGERATAFLNGGLRELPDPRLLLDMETAVARLVRAIDRREPILVHGDYDVDGISGCALLVETLRRCGAVVDYHLPLRLRDGYGLSGAALRGTAAAGVRVVLSVDCGVSAVAEARLAAELGLDLIITDHHQPPAELPAALAVVNPHRAGDPFPEKHLAGVGVAFFLLIALRAALRAAGRFAAGAEPDLRESLDLVALGTIADLVPLVGVNRILVQGGLRRLDQAARPGVAALVRVAGVSRVTCGTVGFQLAPRLNAAGRLEDAALGVELLLTDADDRAGELAGLLDGFNQERRRIEEQTLAEAIEGVQGLDEKRRHSIVLGAESWHPGVIGIVASRLVERYHRPVVLIALDGGQGKGSARSIRGFHLYQALQACSEHLEGYGGHEFAAGLSLEAERLEPFAAAFEAAAAAALADGELVPELGHDGEVTLDELAPGEVTDLARLAPFGIGNPEPAFVVRGVRLRRTQTLRGGHLRFTVQQDGYSLPGVAWRQADCAAALDGPVDLLFTPEFNEYRGRRQLRLRVRDLRESDEG